MLTKHEFIRWANDALPGEKTTYHVGYFFMERWGENAAMIATISAAAWELMEAGKVCLVQRRLGDAFYEYIAIARKKPHKKVVWEGCYDPYRKSYIKPAYIVMKEAA